MQDEKGGQFMKPTQTPEEFISLIERNGRTILQSTGMAQEKEYVQHGMVSCYLHSVFVAYVSIWLARRFRIRVHLRSLIRGALLHDYFLYDWHVKDPFRKAHGFSHATIALNNAERDFTLNLVERDIIVKHMFPLNLTPPRYRESVLVCIADKICAVYETCSIPIPKTVSQAGQI